MRIDPFHLISTPIPLLPQLNLSTQVGLSAEDPTGLRHLGMGFSVWLSVYLPDGSFLRRQKIGRLFPEERRFFDLTALTADLQLEAPTLCVVHRVPEGLSTSGEAEVPEGFDTDFDMYRSVVQFSSLAGGRGSVIYETPPRFNANPSRRGSFLAFSNMIALGSTARSYLCLLHYSVNPDYQTSASRRVLVYRPDGRLAAVDEGVIRPFTMDVIDFARLLNRAVDCVELEQFSFVACSKDASMIPLVLNLNPQLGGISVEHTHPPMSYLNMPVEAMERVRRDALAYYLATRFSAVEATGA